MNGRIHEVLFLKALIPSTMLVFIYYCNCEFGEWSQLVLLNNPLTKSIPLSLFLSLLDSLERTESEVQAYWIDIRLES